MAKGRRGEDRLIHVVLSGEEAHLIAEALRLHCLDCFRDRDWRKMDDLAKLFARLVRGERID